MKLKQWIVIICFLTFNFACDKNAQDNGVLIFSFDFLTGQNGWTEGFSDYPVGEDEFYEIDFQWVSLPEPLNSNEKSLFITGNNHSDDLFMFIKKKITGLLPNTIYQVTFDVEFASIYPTNHAGVGGAPGEGVVMKVGAVNFEPEVFEIQNRWDINIDKGNQSVGGKDMFVVGHVGVADDTIEYTLISNNNFSKPKMVKTNNSGEAWVIIGTDSGFESTTAIYYNNIVIRMKKIKW